MYQGSKVKYILTSSTTASILALEESASRLPNLNLSFKGGGRIFQVLCPAQGVDLTPLHKF